MIDTEKILPQIPHTPGIYIYRDTSGVILYVGKAIDLYKRVRQYFTRDDAVGAKTLTLVAQIATIETIPTGNEFDALLLESKLIRQYMPKYNVIAKDDKSPIYISLALLDPLPIVTLVRRPKKFTPEEQETQGYFGPFQSARTARGLLKTLRRVIPFCTQKQRTGKPCFYTHIGLCRPCPCAIAALPDGEEKKQLTREYRNHIFRLRDILSGKSSTVLHDMEKDMRQLAAEEQYEAAALIKSQIDNFYSIVSKHYDPSVYLQSDTQITTIFEQELATLRSSLQPYYPDINELHRIECIDISNTMGKQAVGSLVVLIDGRIDTSEYRKFKIRQPNLPNDFAMVQEVLTRRLKHPEWEFPDLFVIDGGKGQVSSAQEVLTALSLTIPLIGLAKRQEEIIVPIPDGFYTLRLPLHSPGLHVLQRLRDEAHRFAITFHRQLRSKAQALV